MERIEAGKLVIEHDAEHWRLLANGRGGERALFEAESGQPARFAETFARHRNLPIDAGAEQGTLLPEQVERVVMGWSSKHGLWQLGLMLDDRLAQVRGSSWCGLATWDADTAPNFEAVANHVGQSLASKLARPYAFVPPEPTPDFEQETLPGAMAVSTPYALGIEPPPTLYAPPARMTPPVDTSEVRQAIAQPPLPYALDDWKLQRIDAARVQLALSGAWARVRFWRAGWYIVLAGIFFILTATSLTSGIALPRPEFLIYMGWASVVVMTVGALVTMWRAARQPKRIVFDGEGNRVLWLRGRAVAGEVPPGVLQAVYATHVVGKVGGWAKKQARRVRFGELNLLLGDGTFVHVLTLPRIEEMIPTTDDPLDEEGVVPLTAFNARTKLQSAALAIAETLRVPAMYDKRL